MYLYLFPFIAGAMGWLGHQLFINYLFEKKLPEGIPGAAQKIGHHVAQKVLNMEVLGAKLTNTASLEDMKPYIEHHIDIFLKEKLKEKMPAIAMFVGDKTMDVIKKGLMDEIDTLLPNLLQRYATSLGQKINIEAEVAARINALPVKELINQNLRKERMQFKLFGAISGFAIGLVLLLLSLLLS